MARRNKDETHSLLLQVATQMLGERGFGSTSVDDIAEKAGVAKGTVYYHFKSKAELVDALITEGLTPLAMRMRAAVDESTSARESLQSLVRTELEFIRENRSFAKLLVRELWQEDRAWRETLLLIRERIVTVIREQIERGIASGELRADLDAQFAASSLFALTAVAALDWLALDPERPLEDVAGQIGCLTAIAATDRVSPT